MLVQKQLNLTLQLNQKKKRKPNKNKKPKWKINIVKKIETMRGEMSILSEIERNKDPKNQKSQERYKRVQNHNWH